ncbi:MAG: hypothetical protein Phyf2KO_11290 [Phycisphaerales bacterium]
MKQIILIVDDEPRITTALMVRFEAEGYRVCHAINGLAGIEAAALCSPDIVVLDIRMPDIDGYETCQRIKRLPGMQETPVIFLSANAEDAALQRAFDVGAVEFVSKPYDAEEVITLVQRELRKAASVHGDNN